MTSAIDTLAIGDMSDGMFLTYTALLVVSGLLMVGLAAIGFGLSTVVERVLTGLAGVGFLGYGAYLFLFFDGGSIMVLWYAFILPVLLIFRAVKSAFASSN